MIGHAGLAHGISASRRAKKRRGQVKHVNKWDVPLTARLQSSQEYLDRKLYERFGDADTLSGTGSKRLHAVGRSNSGRVIVKPPPEPEVDQKALQRAQLAPISFCCMDKDFGFRDWCIRTWQKAWFDQSVLAIIVLNTIFLAVADPTIEDTKNDAPVFFYAELVFNVLFTFEMIIKMIAMGLSPGHRPAPGTVCYFTDPWNKFDFVVVLLGWLPVILDVAEVKMGNFTFLRTFRVFKVLKSIQRVEGMRNLIGALISCSPLLVNVMQLLLFLFLVFGIIGQSLFMGVLRQKCFSDQGSPGNYTRTSSLSEVCSMQGDEFGFGCPANQTCSKRNLEWYPSLREMDYQSSMYKGCQKDRSCVWNPNPNHGNVGFDNIGQAFITVLVTVSLEGWVDIAYLYMDAVGEQVIFFFVVLILFGAMFVINLVVAVIYESYTSFAKDHEPISGTLVVRYPVIKTQRFKKNKEKKLTWRAPGEEKLEVDEGCTGMLQFYASLRDYCAKVIWHDWFESFMTMCIVVNTILLACEYHDMDQVWVNTLEVCNWVLTGIFAIEMIIKFLGFGVRNYMMDTYNIFDFVVVVVSLVEIGMKYGGSGGGKSGVSAFRSLRLIRVMRSMKMIKKWKSMHLILSAIMRSGPGLFNFTTLLMLFMIVYALCGMQLFAGKLDPDLRANFDTLFNALLTVFQVVSGENWNDVLYGTMKVGHPVQGAFFTVTMYMIGNYIILNIFVAILLDNFEKADSDKSRGAEKTLYDDLASNNEALKFVTFVKEVLKELARMCCGRCLEEVDSGEVEKPVLPDLQIKATARRLSTAPTYHNYSDGQKAYALDMYNRLQKSIELSTHQRGPCAFKNTFVAAELTDRILQISDEELDLTAAIALGQRMLDMGLVRVKYRNISGRPPNDLEELTAIAGSDSNGATPPPPPQDSRALNRTSLLEDSKPMPHLKRISSAEMRDYDPMRAVADTRRSSLTLKDDDDHFLFYDDDTLLSFRSTGRHRLYLVGFEDGGDIKKASTAWKDHAILAKRAAMSQGNSLGCFSQESKFRKACIFMVTHWLFDSVVLCLIVASSIMLALDEPGLEERDPGMKSFINTVDYVFTALFFVEMCVKLVAMGLISTPHAYLGDPWNVLDGTIVIFSLITVAFSTFDLSFFKSLRAVRALRPLRMINRNPGMKMVVNALIKALPEVLNVALVGLGFFILFAILGGSLFRGAFYHCEGNGESDVHLTFRECCNVQQDLEDDELPVSAANLFREFGCNGTYHDSDGVVHQREWVNDWGNFDNVGNSLLVLFEISSLEGWPDLMTKGMDIRAGKQSGEPDGWSEGHSPANALFFVMFVIIGSFFMVNLFVGVVVNKFQNAKKEQDDPFRSILLTGEQQRFRDDMVEILKHRAPVVNIEPETWHDLRMPFFIVGTSQQMDIAIMIIIMLNVCWIGTQHFNQAQVFDDTDFVLNWAFTIIFTLEMVVKVIGLSWNQYWRNSWNKFDFIIVVVSWTEALEIGMGVDFTLFRVFRVARIAKLVKANQGLKALLLTLVKSLPSLFNVGSLLALLFFIFAVMGMNLFGDAIQDGENLRRYNNFETFGTSMITLFRCLTGENWPKIMYQLADPTNYDDKEDNNAGSAGAFFLIFAIMGNFMMLNLFIAVILENFGEFMALDEEKDENEPRTGIKENKKLITMFMEAWMSIDTKGTLKIPAYSIVHLLYKLKPPMGFRGLLGPLHQPRTTRDRRKNTEFLMDYVTDLDLYMDSKNDIHYLEVLLSLIQQANHTYIDYNNSMKDEVILQLAEKLKTMVHPSIKSTLKELQNHPKHSGPSCFGSTWRTIQKKLLGRKDLTTPDPPLALDITIWVNSAVFVQNRYRGRLLRKQFIRDLEAQNLMTPRISNLYNVTIPYLMKREQELKALRRASNQSLSSPSRMASSSLDSYPSLSESPAPGFELASLNGSAENQV